MPDQPKGANEVVWRLIADLVPSARNARKHSNKQIDKITKSIGAFGFNNPVLTRGNDIVAGHGRVLAAERLNMEAVPCIDLTHLNATEARAYLIADNKLAELAEWDEGILAEEVKALCDDDFDVTLTGFDTHEIDTMMKDDAATATSGEGETVPAIESGPATTRMGDVWTIDGHRLICGNSLEASTYINLMDGEEAEMVFIDPPYNVKIDYLFNYKNDREKPFDNFSMASGEMSEEEFVEFLTTAFELIASHSKEGSIHYICMDWRHLFEITVAGKKAYHELKNVCVWDKNSKGMGSFYRCTHEMVFVFKKGKAAHINNFLLGEHGRYRSNVWKYTGQNIPKEGDDGHPTVKPTAMVADTMLDCSNRGGIVLDAFVGSGTTLLAAAETGRIGYGIELDPKFCDLTLRRMEAATGKEATLVGTGQTFAEVRAERETLPEDEPAE